MTTINEYDDTVELDALKAARKERLFSVINKTSKYLDVLGLGWIAPIAKIAAGDSFKVQGRELWQTFFIPL
ncbi:MAG: hypothetical protein V7750_14740, partial [Sneathiella sp.]